MEQGDHRGRERGAAAVEYGLLLAGVALVLVVTYWALGDLVVGLFTHTCGELGREIGTVTVTCD